MIAKHVLRFIREALVLSSSTRPLPRTRHNENEKPLRTSPAHRYAPQPISKRPPSMAESLPRWPKPRPPRPVTPPGFYLSYPPISTEIPIGWQPDSDWGVR